MNRPEIRKAAPTHGPGPADATSFDVASNSLADEYARIRATSLALAAPLTAEDCQVQSMPDASPTKWHLAHVTWFFESFVLERFESEFHAFDPAFRELFNSYYYNYLQVTIHSDVRASRRPSAA
jgi:DinB superfamily